MLLCQGMLIALVPGDHGLVNPAEVKKRIRKSVGSQSHFPNASLICLENTSNRGGGLVTVCKLLMISEILPRRVIVGCI